MDNSGPLGLLILSELDFNQKNGTQITKKWFG